ncbi:MAG: DNA primase [Planctomycetes bacterium]|nr:DNA primase [Planctomycetota bacterium]
MDRFEEAKLRIKEATDLVALIESYLPLKQRGRNLVALCPFHAENSPSFSVNREGQFFHCFGCGKSGDAFTWLMERDGLTFREAMEVLADRAGVPLEGVWKGRGEEARKGPDPYAALAEVARFCQVALAGQDGEPARRYLEGRGLLAAVEPWRLGYHPLQGALVRFARERQLPRAVLEEAGLLRNGRESFAGRLMFPIEDERGRTVGFGGRIVPGVPGSEGDGDYKPPKYLNSPESPIFNKRRVLFGLHRAKQAGQRRLVVMEGYTDVIACHLAGFTGAVASLGTAFTQDHARMVERYATDGLVLMFDGDRAGQQAAERALRELVNSRLPVRIALVGDAQDGAAKDPADVVTQRAGEDPELVLERRARFADLLDGAEDALAVWFRLLRRRLDLSQAVHLETAARECAAVLALVAEPVRRAGYLQDMARHLAVPAPTLERLLQKIPRPRADAKAAVAAPAEPPRAPSALERAELDLLACVLARPLLLVDLDTSADAPLGSAAVAALFAMATDGVAIGRTVTADLLKYLFVRVADVPELRTVLGLAAERAAAIGDPQQTLAGLRQGLLRRRDEPRRRALREQLQQALAAGDRARAEELQRQLLAVHRADRPFASASRPAAAAPAPAGSAGPDGPGAAPPAGAAPQAAPDEVPPD